MSDSPDPLAFTPVETASTRHDGWTPARQVAFIAQLSRLGLVGAAARAVGKSPKSAYLLRRRSGAESFSRAWEHALEIGRGSAVSLGIDRAINGTVQPIFYHGRRIGERIHYDDRLLIAALRLEARKLERRG